MGEGVMLGYLARREQPSTWFLAKIAGEDNVYTSYNSRHITTTAAP
tara:strand:+ start:220 stop:357 length:138 start_codon:yes stop_codon:yes gene_type:complete